MGDTQTVSKPSTGRSKKPSQSDKVIKFLKEHPDQPITPKKLAFLTNVNYGNVKKICKRKLLDGILEQPYSGHYQYKHIVSMEELKLLESYKELLSHNLMLILGDKKGVTPIRGTIDKPLHCWTYENTGLMEFEKRKLQVWEYKNATVFYLGCSTNPLSGSDISFFTGFLACAGYDVRTARIGRWELNNDTKDLNIEGAQTIEMMTFKRGIERYYNKGKNLRHEVIIKGSVITLEEAVASMRGQQAMGTNTLIEQGGRQEERDKLLIEEINNLRHDIKVMRMRETKREEKRQERDKQIEVDLKEKYGLKRASKL